MILKYAYKLLVTINTFNADLCYYMWTCKPIVYFKLNIMYKSDQTHASVSHTYSLWDFNDTEVFFVLNDSIYDNTADKTQARYI